MIWTALIFSVPAGLIATHLHAKPDLFANLAALRMMVLKYPRVYRSSSEGSSGNPG